METSCRRVPNDKYSSRDNPPIKIGEQHGDENGERSRDGRQ